MILKLLIESFLNSSERMRASGAENRNVIKYGMQSPECLPEQCIFMVGSEILSLQVTTRTRYYFLSNVVLGTWSSTKELREDVLDNMGTSK